MSWWNGPGLLFAWAKASSVGVHDLLTTADGAVIEYQELTTSSGEFSQNMSELRHMNPGQIARVPSTIGLHETPMSNA